MILDPENRDQPHQKPYTYQEYPRCVYHPTLGGKMVNSMDEYKQLGEGWTLDLPQAQTEAIVVDPVMELNERLELIESHLQDANDWREKIEAQLAELRTLAQPAPEPPAAAAPVEEVAKPKRGK